MTVIAALCLIVAAVLWFCGALGLRSAITWDLAAKAFVACAALAQWSSWGVR